MIIELEQFAGRLTDAEKKLSEIKEGLHTGQMQEELTELHEEMNAEGFWDDLERSTHVNRRIAALEGKLKELDDLAKQCADIRTLMELAEEENDEDLTQEARHRYMPEVNRRTWLVDAVTGDIIG